MKSELKQMDEEMELIQQFFNHSKEGFYIEVGANDPVGSSQTYHLEQLGWTGILVEPLERFFEKMKEVRPNSSVFKVACTNPQKVGPTEIYIPDESTGLATLEKNTDDLGVKYTNIENVEAVTLDSLIDEVNPSSIDFVSIDTEGTELDVLQGFDIAKHKPKLILLEDKLNNLKKHRCLKSLGYKIIRRTLLNNWYVPQETKIEGISLCYKFSLFKKLYLGLPFRKLHFWRRKRRYGV